MGNMTRIIFCCIIALTILSGCGETKWYLNGRSNQQFQSDAYICRDYSQNDNNNNGARFAGQGLGSNNSGVAAGGLAVAFLEAKRVEVEFCDCMQSKGYIKADQNTP